MIPDPNLFELFIARYSHCTELSLTCVLSSKSIILSVFHILIRRGRRGRRGSKRGGAASLLFAHAMALSAAMEPAVQARVQANGQIPDGKSPKSLSLTDETENHFVGGYNTVDKKPEPGVLHAIWSDERLFCWGTKYQLKILLFLQMFRFFIFTFDSLAFCPKFVCYLSQIGARPFM